MPAGTTLSGLQGKLFKVGAPDVEIEFGKWTFDEDVDTDRYATSKSGGKKLTEPGNASAVGTVEGKRVDAPQAERIEQIIAIGQKLSLKLEFKAGGGINCPAVIKTRHFEVDPSTGVVQGYNFNFESNGDWTFY